MADNSSSSTNTILITLVLVILVGFIVWWFAVRNPGVQAPTETNDTSGINVDVNFPNGNEGGSQTNPN